MKREGKLAEGVKDNEGGRSGIAVEIIATEEEDDDGDGFERVPRIRKVA